MVALAASMAASRSGTRSTMATGPKISSWATGMSMVTPVSTVGGNHQPSPSGTLAPACTVAPWRRAASTWPTSSSRWASVTIGPMSVAGSKGSPTTSASIASMKRASNSSATSSTTMNRLAAMHDCPLFCTRAVTAVRTHGLEVGRWRAR